MPRRTIAVEAHILELMEGSSDEVQDAYQSVPTGYGGGPRADMHPHACLTSPDLNAAFKRHCIDSRHAAQYDLFLKGCTVKQLSELFPDKPETIENNLKQTEAALNSDPDIGILTVLVETFGWGAMDADSVKRLFRPLRKSRGKAGKASTRTPALCRVA